MTILDLMKQAKEREIPLTSLAFEYWNYLEPEEQSALGRELCATFEEKYESDLIHNLYEYETSLFVDHYIKEIDKLIEMGEGVSIEIKNLSDLFDFINNSFFDKEIFEKLNAYNSMAINFREEWTVDEDEKYYTITCDFLEVLESVKKALTDLYC